MHDDPIATLERELIGAARRRARPITAPDERVGGALPRRRGSLGAFAAVALSGLALVMALGALVSLRGHPAARPSPTHAGARAPGRQQLIDIIGVLRRPQTPADLNPRILSDLSHTPLIALRGEPDLSLVRLATTAWGERLYLVLYRPTSAADLAAVARRFPGAAGAGFRARVRDETLGVMSAGGGGGGADAAAIEAGTAMEMDGAGRSFAGGSTQTRFILVVPDGVSKVEFYFPPQAIPAGGPVYRHSLAVTVPVSGNIAAVQVARQCCAAQPALIWYAPDGRVIKRIGSTSPPPTPPQPTPETAQSRAAERNPATPNRVWVTPVSAGPSSAIKVRFRLLLNDVDYQFRMTGPSGPGCRNSASFIVGGGIDDVRGRIFGGRFSPAPQRWCPGTYQVSVSVYDLGRQPGVLRHPPAPFGTATFTVKR